MAVKPHTLEKIKQNKRQTKNPLQVNYVFGSLHFEESEQ